MKGVIMVDQKMGNKSAVEKAAIRFEKLYRQPVSKRISDFLKEEAKKERQESNSQKKKIAQPAGSGDLEF
jgi:hypothetical protein